MAVLLSAKKVVRNLLILLVGLAVLVVVVNLPLFDEELVPAVAELSEPYPMPPAEQNAYIALVGFAAASDRDMVVVGQEAFDQYQKMAPVQQFSGNLGEEDTLRILGGAGFDDQWISQLGHCPGGEQNCLLFFSTRAPGIIDGSPRAAKMIERFQVLAAMPEFAVPVGSNIFLEYHVVLRTNDLMVGHAYSEDGPRGAITALEQILGFWRGQLHKPDVLIGRMIAIAAIRKNLQLLSNLMELEQIAASEYPRIEQLLRPLTPSELDMTGVYLCEQKFSSWALEFYSVLVAEDEGWWERTKLFAVHNLLMQTNATQNLQYKRAIDPAACLSRQSWQSYKSYLMTGSNAECGIETAGGNGKRWWLNLYNPGGIWLQSFVSMDLYVPYIARGHDINGLLALLRMQLHLRSGAVASINELLQSNLGQDKYLPNPVQYNPETKKLYFDCLQKPNNRECAVTLFAEQ